MNFSLIKSIKITNFRAIEEIEFVPGRRLTLMTGKNGTAKSTILGMIAQPFSFTPKLVLGYSENEVNKTKSGEEKEELLKEIQKIKTIYNKNFESNVNQHFKLSEIDARGEEHAFINFYNHINKKDINMKVESNDYSDRANPRLVTRKPNMPLPEEGEKDQRSSNEVFPVIYLGLNRVFPIVLADSTNIDLKLTDDEHRYIKRLYDQILLNSYDNNLQSTNTKNKNTLSFLSSEKNINMISSGEDNVGQILGAILSFRRLKQNYQEYNGGILLIDEVDATLYPGAQRQLLDVLLAEAIAYNLQIFVTSHSTYLIDMLTAKIENSSSSQFPYPGDLKIIPLKKEIDSTVTIRGEGSVLSIWHDLHEQTRITQKEEKIRIYFEDEEASFIYKHLTSPEIKKRTEIVNVSLGCEQYFTLQKANIPEFSNYSCIILDGDFDKNKASKAKNFVVLPTINESPPEKLIYEYLHTENCSFWNDCDEFYTKAILIGNTHNMAIKEIIEGDYKTGKQDQSGSEYYKTAPREVWKKWFKEEQKNWKLKKNNPVVYWKKDNLELVEKYEDSLKRALTFVASNLGLKPF